MKSKFSSLLIIATFLFSNSILSQTTVNKEERSEDLIAKGQDLMGEKKYDEALTVFRKIHRNDSNFILGGLNELSALLNLEKNEEGLALCEHLLKEKSNLSPNILVYKGDFLDNMGRSDEAERVFEKACVEYPLYHTLQYEHAILLIRKKKYDQAYEHLIKAININPFHALSHYQLGLMAYRNNNITGTMLALEFSIMCDPYSDRAKNLIPDLEKIVKLELEFDSITNIKVFQNQNDFTEMESLLRSKVALSKKYKLKTKLTYDINKQTQLLIDNIGNYSDVKGFYNSFYGKFFSTLSSQNHLEAFGYYILSGLSIAKVDSWVKKNADQSKGFETWAYNFICKDLAKFNDLLNGKMVNVPHWYKNSLIYGAGNRDDQGLDQGYWNFYFNNGIIKSEGAFLNDKKTGTWKYYYPNGVIKEEISYENGDEKNYGSYYSNGNPKVQLLLDQGKIVGEKKVYYSNGNVAYTTNFKDNIENGAEVHYYRNGTLRYKINNENGLLNGDLTEYFKNGKIYQKVNFIAGKREGPSRTFFNTADNSLASEGSYLKGKKSGEWKEYYKSGKLYKVSHYSETGELDGNLKEYYENGKVQLDEDYTLGKLNGPSKLYNEDGSLWQEFVYKKNRFQEYRAFKGDGTKICDNKINGKNFKLVLYHPNGNKRREGEVSDGLLQGTWKDYNLFGVLTTEAIYNEGDYNGIYTEFFPNGKTKKTRHYEAGTETGLYQSYYINGQLESEGQMTNGEAEGYWNFYFVDGTTRSKIYYVEGERDGWCEYYAVNGKLETENLYKEFCLVKAVYHDTLGAVQQMVDMPGGNGVLERKTPEGIVLFKKTFVKDLPEGLSESYFPDGKIETSVNYANGMKEGKSTSYNALGHLINEVAYFFDEKTGKEKSYDLQGVLINEYGYENGDFNGKCLSYYSNGKLEKDIVYDYGDAEGPSNLYDEAGELIYTRQFHNDLMVSYSYYDKNGQLHAPLVLPNGESPIVCYYKNGQKSLEATYTNGDLNGKRTMYHSNGKLKQEGTFYYDNHNGTFTEYFPNGTVKIVDQYFYGKREGVSREYFENGKLMSEENYHNGTLNGLSKFYDKTGKLIKTVFYYNGDPVRIL